MTDQLPITDFEEFKRECAAGNLLRITSSSIDKSWLAMGLAYSCESRNIDLFKYLIHEMSKCSNLFGENSTNFWTTVFIRAGSADFSEALELIKDYPIHYPSVYSWATIMNNPKVIDAVADKFGEIYEIISDVRDKSNEPIAS